VREAGAPDHEAGVFAVGPGCRDEDLDPYAVAQRALQLAETLLAPTRAPDRHLDGASSPRQRTSTFVFLGALTDSIFIDEPRPETAPVRRTIAKGTSDESGPGAAGGFLGTGRGLGRDPGRGTVGDPGGAGTVEAGPSGLDAAGSCGVPGNMRLSLGPKTCASQKETPNFVARSRATLRAARGAKAVKNGLYRCGAARSEGEKDACV